MKKKKIITIVLILLMFFIIAGIAGVYLYYGYEHKDQFFKGVFINGTDVSGMTVEEVETQIAQQAEDYSLTVTDKAGTQVIINKEDINYHYVSDGSVQKYFDEQKWWEWYKGYMQNGAEKLEVSVAVDYDKDMLRSVMESWDFMKAENQVEPVDAYMDYVDGAYAVIPEVVGSKINSDMVYEALVAAVDETKAEVNIEETGAYILPNIVSTDELLNANCETLNTQANCTITHTLPNGETMTINRETLLGWMSQDESGRYYRDDAVFTQKITEHVATMAEKVSALNSKNITFTGANGSSHTVRSYVTMGWAVDTSGETAQLTEEIYANTSADRTPVYSSTMSSVNGGVGDTFVEIDLSSQHLWYHQDGQVVLESDIVSGTYNNEEYRTPAGLYKINYKQRDRVLRGEQQSDGSYEYESPVDYWLPFNGGIGMHDASWRVDYGGEIFMNSGSHGCINMPHDKVSQLYDMISTGCIVICYY